MNAPTVGPSPGVSTAANAAANAPAQAPTADFAHQLNTARQRSDTSAQEQPATRQPPAKRSSDDGRGKHAPSRSDSHKADPGASRTGKGGDADSAKSHASSTSDPQAKPTAAATASAATPTVSTTATPLVAETVADGTTDDAAPGAKDTDDAAQAAAALVGAMLALMSPSAGEASPVGAADPTAASDKPVTANATVAPLLPAGDATATMMAANVASLALPAQWLPGQSLPSGEKSVRDLAQADAAPSLGLSTPSLVAPAALVSAPVLAPASAQSFGQELGQQMAWFVGQGIKQARIRLNPDELGSLDLKISVNHDRVDVVFQAQHPAAVTAVQQSLPQLNQMLSQHGLSLGNTEVGQHDRGDQSSRGSHGAAVSEIDEIHAASVVTPLSQLGLVDAFA